jgi:methane/ammonia monooxygenase subunit B
MVEKRIFVFGLAVVLALGTLGFNWVESVLPTADARCTRCPSTTPESFH